MEVRRINPVPSELYHHGVKGQKWGIRRYQNPDGSLTPEGRKKLRQFKTTETAEARNKYSQKRDKLKKKISEAKTEEKKQKLQQKLKTAKTNTDKEIKVIKNYTLKDINKEKMAVGAEVTLKTVAAIGFLAIPLAPDIAGFALIATSQGAKQRYRLKGV